MKKKFVTGLLMSLLLMLMTAVSGCGGNDNGKQSTENESIKLIMTSWRVEDKKQYDDIIAEFQKEHPNVSIEFKPEKATEYDTILDTSLKGGQAADIIQLRPYVGARKIADAGYLEPLDEINGLQNIDNSLFEAAKGSDGKIYGIPLSTNTIQIYYNKKIFEENGLSIPATWDDLIQVSESLKSKNITPFAFGAKDGWILSLTHAAIGPPFYGGNAFVDKILRGETNFLDPTFIESIQKFNELTPYFPENFIGLSYNDAQALFYTEQAAMYIGGSFDLEPLRSKNPELQLDFFPVPAKDNNSKPSMTVWVDGSFGVNRNSPHKSEALKFIEFMTTKTFGQMFADSLGRVSAVKGVVPKDPIVNKMAELSQKYGTPYMILVYFAEGNPSTKKVLENELQGMFLKENTPESVAEKVQKSADTWFKP